MQVLRRGALRNSAKVNPKDVDGRSRSAEGPDQGGAGVQGRAKRVKGQSQG